MSVDKDAFGRRDTSYDLQRAGATPAEWQAADRVPAKLVPTHCSFCGIQCAMYLKVSEGKVIGVEPRDYPHNRGALCPKGVVAYQQAGHPERLRYPMLRRRKGDPLERVSWDQALDHIAARWRDELKRFQDRRRPFLLYPE